MYTEAIALAQQALQILAEEGNEKLAEALLSEQQLAPGRVETTEEAPQEDDAGDVTEDGGEPMDTATVDAPSNDLDVDNWARKP